jgi:hypothetical protein
MMDFWVFEVLLEIGGAFICWRFLTKLYLPSSFVPNNFLQNG